MLTFTALRTLLTDALGAFWEANPTRLAAAISFYAAFSLAPLTVLAVILTSHYAAADPGLSDNFFLTLKTLMGSQNATTIDGLVTLIGGGEWSVQATIFGVLSLLFGASGVFGEIQAALNTIWKAPVGTSYWRGYLHQRLWTFLMLLFSGAILAGSLIAFAYVTVLANYFGNFVHLPFDLLRLGHGVLSFVIVSVVFAAIYRALPDVVLHWRDVLLGGIVTSLLFTVGKALMGWYLGRYSLASVYGPAAAIMAILFWLYYSSLIFLFGAHLIFVYARRYGSLAPPPGSGLPPALPPLKEKEEE